MNSRNEQQSQPPSQEALSSSSRVKPEEMSQERSSRAVNESEATSSEHLMEQVVAKENMFAALRRVQQNGGAPGSDGMTVNELPAFLKAIWPSIKAKLLEDKYKPQPVRRVEIPKPDGGVRLLGIPNVVDRLIQQALLQVLTPIFDPTFSEQSFGWVVPRFLSRGRSGNRGLVMMFRCALGKLFGSEIAKRTVRMIRVVIDAPGRSLAPCVVE